jgi:transcriptional regulator with GAF, ATPase, and Fis domain
MRFARAERGGLFLAKQDGKLDLVASRNLGLVTVKDASFRSEFEIIKEVAQSGREIIKEGTFDRDIKSNVSGRRGWIICSPVVFQDNILGVLYLSSHLIGSNFPQSHRSLLKPICNQIALAVDNVRVYEELTELKDRLEEEARFYRQEQRLPHLDQIVGTSQPMLEVFKEIQQVAPTGSDILITGETGVGKDLLAHTIHRISKRAEGPFISVSIASLDPNLIASELFGHERGAFTGAVKSKAGRFELANGGILFLDDVDTTPLEIQGKLLRVLHDKKFERVGGTKTLHSNFQLFAATNKDLRAMVEKGLFREDLYYRLKAFPIHIPPLRDRKDDIPLLVNHFLDIFNKKMNKKIKEISSYDMTRLVNYSWPGNIRELKHVIERAVILSNGNYLNLRSFAKESAKRETSDEFLPLKDMERSYIISALEKCNWRVSGENGAAKLLHVKPATLYSKMRRSGISKKFSV